MMYMMNATYGLNLLKIKTEGLPLILNFTAITSPGYGVPPAVQISATECALYFCVNTYEARITEGIFSETRTAIATSSNTTSWTSTEENFSITPDTCYFNGTRYEKPYKTPENCIYTVNWLSRLAMQNSLSPLMKGKGTLFMSNRPSWTPSTAQAIYGTEGNLTDMKTMFESMASSLTLNARSNVCAASVNGTTWKVQSFVHVRWNWLIFPGALVVLSLVFLVITVVHTRNQYIWKSSPLALLFSNVYVESSGPLRSSPTLRNMEDTSRKMEVWLESSAEGIRLKAIPT
jgi:hypothetical protein